MSRPITAAEFHAAEGVADWRVLTSGACAYFRGTFDQIKHLVTDTADIRPDGITVRLPLTEASIDEARRISARARELGATPEPVRLQHVGLTLDALVSAGVMPFWLAVLGYEPEGDEDVVDPRGQGPGIWFQDMDVPRTDRNRLHIDVSVPHDQAEQRVQQALRAGGTLKDDSHAPSWWVLADAEVCIATWVGR
ncbi:4a-hydroxytetrahydrobiopterin dehydratase [Lentzea atacamensis]|uniref:4a-hydroxytetrahydrobiopterin dehydratase n=1 Tax=Lentzea atacamensis TaxID=531938 RepID=A0A316HUT6_9PSEU|nr:VOC family protein [Lentzea atacamensis]PWK84229.1 4a-hydroxytetrahydrobiopterin dehydratase [Lentzea atacamensis]